MRMGIIVQEGYISINLARYLGGFHIDTSLIPDQGFILNRKDIFRISNQFIRLFQNWTLGTLLCWHSTSSIQMLYHLPLVDRQLRT